MVGLLAGCAATHKGTTEVKWEKSATDSRIFPALHSGEYALYSGTDVKPKFVIEVHRGDNLGFEKSSNPDMVTAVAGNRRFDVPAKASYYWNYRGQLKD
jgi:hypothetical protein